MNAHSITAHNLIAALTGNSGAAQQVHWCASLYSDADTRHVVLVIPGGEKRGHYYDCDDHDLAMLRSGLPPEDLELEPLTEDECEAFDNSTYWEEW